MDEQKVINKVVHTVYSTEELQDLQRRAEQVGGQITRTITMTGGAGVSAEVEIPADKRIF